MQTLSKTLSFLILAWVAWLAWQNLGPRKPEMGPLRQVLADEAIVAIARDIHDNRKGARRAVFIHFENDPTDYVSNGLRRVLEQRGTFDLGDRSFMEKLRGLLGLRQPANSSTAAAAQAVRDAGVDMAITGRVHELESYSGGAKARIDFSLVSAGGAPVYKGQFLKTISDAKAAPAAPGPRGASWSDWLTNMLTWALAVLLLPVFTIAFIRAMVRRNSNMANAFVLAIYTSIGVIAAYLLLGRELSGGWLAALLAGAGALTLAYTIRITTLAVRLEE